MEGEGIEIPRYAVLDRDSADPKRKFCILHNRFFFLKSFSTFRINKKRFFIRQRFITVKKRLIKRREKKIEKIVVL